MLTDPTRRTSQSDHESLGEVPQKPEPQPVTPTPTVPLGGGGRGQSPTGEIPPTERIMRSQSDPKPSKPLIISLGAATAVFAALSGIMLYQSITLKSALGDETTKAEAALKTSAALESDLKNALDERTAVDKSHAEALTSKERELASAVAKAEKVTLELEGESANVKDLTTKLKDAAEERERLEGELASLKETNMELTDVNAKAAPEVRGPKNEPDAPLTAPTVIETRAPISTHPTKILVSPVVAVEHAEQKSQTFAWLRLGKFENGPNKGRWYFVAPDEFVSPLYNSRWQAVVQAELRAGVRQPVLPSAATTPTKGGSDK